MSEIGAVTSRLNIDRGLFFHLNVAAFLCLCAYFVIKSQHQINGTNAEKNDHHCSWWHNKPTITIMTICNLALSLTSSIFFARDDLDTVLKLSALVWRHSIVSLCLIWSANRLFSLPIAYIFFGARCIYFEFSWINGPFSHIKILFLLLSDKHQPTTEINSFSYRCCVHFFCLHLGFWSIMVISLSFVTRICNENDQKISEYETEMYEGKKREYTVELMPNDRKMYMHLTCLIHFLLSVQFISIAVKEKRSARAREKERETNTTKAHLTFSRCKMHLLIRICCISFIQFGNHVPFTFLIGRALVSAPFISILINIFLVCGMCFLPFWLGNTGIEHRLIETEIMITAKAVLSRSKHFFLLRTKFFCFFFLLIMRKRLLDLANKRIRQHTISSYWCAYTFWLEILFEAHTFIGQFNASS